MTHPTDPPPAFTPTTIPAVAHVNHVYVVLQGVTPGSGARAVLMGGYGYLEWSSAGGCWHEGLDLNSMGGGDADLGALVVAPVAGVVTFVGAWDGRSAGFGNHLAVWLDDPRACRPCYLHAAHLDDMLVRVGERVAPGQVVASCGKSGWQPYAHVHLALWHAVPPGGWSFWQAGYSREWVAARTVDPQPWYWATVAKAGEMSGLGPDGGGLPPEVAAMLSDWEVLNWIAPELWAWAGVPYNPEALTSKAWLEELRQGRYRGRPRTADRAYGAPVRGAWAEFEGGVCTTRSDSGEWSWQG